MRESASIPLMIIRYTIHDGNTRQQYSHPGNGRSGDGSQSIWKHKHPVSLSPAAIEFYRPCFSHNLVGIISCARKPSTLTATLQLIPAFRPKHRLPHYRMQQLDTWVDWLVCLMSAEQACLRLRPANGQLNGFPWYVDAFFSFRWVSIFLISTGSSMQAITLKLPPDEESALVTCSKPGQRTNVLWPEWHLLKQNMDSAVIARYEAWIFPGEKLTHKVRPRRGKLQGCNL